MSSRVTTVARPPEADRKDTVRLVGVTVAEILCVLGTLLGVGVFGGPPVAQAAGGALAADATLIAPGAAAFSIWSVIYLGLAAYTVWQWLPAQRTATRHRRIGALVAASMLLNAAWLLVTRAGWIPISVLVILALVAVLGVLIRRITTTPGTGGIDTVVVEGTFGLYVGWVSVAVCANVTAALVDGGMQPSTTVSAVVAVLVLLVAGVVAAVLAVQTRGNPAIALAMAWGIGWIAVARLTGEPASVTTGIAAVVVAVAILGFTALRLVTVRRSATMHRPGADRMPSRA